MMIDKMCLEILTKKQDKKQQVAKNWVTLVLLQGSKAFSIFQTYQLQPFHPLLISAG